MQLKQMMVVLACVRAGGSGVLVFWFWPRLRLGNKGTVGFSNTPILSDFSGATPLKTERGLVSPIQGNSADRVLACLKHQQGVPFLPRE